MHLKVKMKIYIFKDIKVNKINGESFVVIYV